MIDQHQDYPDSSQISHNDHAFPEMIPDVLKPASELCGQRPRSLDSIFDPLGCHEPEDPTPGQDPQDPGLRGPGHSPGWPQGSAGDGRLYKENENAWKELLEGLMRRKINRPLLAIVDGNAGLRSTLDLAWPGIKVQRCTVHKLRNLQTYCPKAVYPEVKNSFNHIIQATSYETGKAAYSRFLGKWSKDLPKVIRSLEEAGEELLTFYAFPQEQWKCLRTTNPIERLNGEFKRRVKTQCSLPSENSAMLILFGLILAGQIQFRKIDGWRKIVELYVPGRKLDSQRYAS